MPWTKADVDKHKKGLTDAQKARWVRVANSTRKTCMDRGGSESHCDGLAVRTANGVVGNAASMNCYSIQVNNYDLRYEQFQGRKHLVLPVVMMVEGVHNGSHGPLYHTMEELGKFPGAWNGIPVSLDHPEYDGVGISANDPEILDTGVVGRVFNTHVDGEKLRAEAWIDEQALQRLSADTFMAISQQRPLEVSVGVFSEDEPVEGDWNGEHYVAVARNLRPDHLALLPPGVVGACSWQDGCGIRNNKEGGEGMDIVATVKELTARGYSVARMYKESMLTLIDAIRQKVDAMDTDARVHYLEDVYDNYFVYRSSSRGENVAPMSRLYKRKYKTNSDGTVEFEGDPIPVVRKVQYQEVASEYGETNNNSKEGQAMTDDKKKPCCPEKVELLIQSAHSTFVEGDRAWLEAAEEEFIDRLIGMQKNSEEIAEKLAAAEKKTETQETEKKDGETEEDENVNMNKEQAQAVLAEQLSNPDKFMELLPGEVRDQVEHGLQLHRDYRATLVTQIQANTDAYTAEELQGMKTPALTKLAKAVKAPPVDYSAQVGARPSTNQETTQAPLIPPQI